MCMCSFHRNKTKPSTFNWPIKRWSRIWIIDPWRNQTKKKHHNSLICMTCCSEKNWKQSYRNLKKERKESLPSHAFFSDFTCEFSRIFRGYDKYVSPPKASNKTINWIELFLWTSSNVTLIHLKGIEDRSWPLPHWAIYLFQPPANQQCWLEALLSKEENESEVKLIVDFPAHHVRLPESRSSSERESYRLPQIIEDIAWNYPPRSSSHHQEFNKFSKESL